MIRNRIEGLVSLHGLWVAGMVTALFGGYWWVTEQTRWIVLAPGFGAGVYSIAIFLGMLLGARVLHGYGERLVNISWTDAVQLTAQQVTRLVLVVLAVVFATKDAAASRVFLGAFIGGASVVVLLANRYFPGLIARLVFRSREVPTLVIGSPAQRGRVNEWLSGQEQLGVAIAGFVVRDRQEENDPSVLGEVRELPRILQETDVRQIVLPLTYLQPEQTRLVLALARSSGCRIRVVEDLEEGLARPLAMEVQDGIAVASTGAEPLENPVNRGIKRAFDIAVSLPVVLFVLPPLTLVVAVMQRLQSPGPVFFRQPRYGSDRRKFLILKFRTMHAVQGPDKQHGVQARRGDARIYPFGVFLRRSSLDELPQFINVLLGDMSVAGPRPHLTDHDDIFALGIEDYRSRHFVKPGITGLAQSEGFRGEITDPRLLEERIRRDLAYIRSWSLGLDIRIVLRTARQVLFPPKSAY